MLWGLPMNRQIPYENSEFGVRAYRIFRVLLGSILMVLSTICHAVVVNPQGLGEVLLFPYYGTTGGFDTYINLANTRDESKAIKVRVRESMNGEVVLEFNLYLAPHDHWSATLSARTDDQGAELRTIDNSCTVPAMNERAVPLSAHNYSNDGISGLERTREGFIEVIEMAVVSPGSMDWPDAIRQGYAGGSAGCERLEEAWANEGAWSQSSEDGAAQPAGGLYGIGVLIDVETGTEVAFDAVAISAFSNTGVSFHSEPGASSPTLGSGRAHYQLVVDGALVEGLAESGVDALSAVLMQSSITNDYVLEPSIAAETQWIVTFPTKRDYVSTTGVRAPFSSRWDRARSTACEAFDFDYYDRESGVFDQDSNNSNNPWLGVRPAPEEPVVTALCAQANVFSFSYGNTLGASTERNAVRFVLIEEFINGFATMDFSQERLKLDTVSHAFSGLPVIGFALQRYRNGTIEVDGERVLSNYMGARSHVGDVRVDAR